MIDYSLPSKKSDDSLKKPVKHSFPLIILVGIFFLLIIFAASSPSEPIERKTESPISIKIGDEATLNWHENAFDCSESVLVATTKESHEKVTKTLLANDEIGIAELLISGEAFVVPNCTKIKIIDTTMFIRQVRILEGDQFGKSGWVAFEFIKAQ